MLEIKMIIKINNRLYHDDGCIYIVHNKLIN